MIFRLKILINYAGVALYSLHLYISKIHLPNSAFLPLQMANECGLAANTTGQIQAPKQLRPGNPGADANVSLPAACSSTTSYGLMGTHKRPTKAA